MYNTITNILMFVISIATVVIILLLHYYYHHHHFFIIIIIVIIIIITLTHSKTILENTVEIEPQLVALDFKNLSQYSSRSK